jgi:hypothetical protein
MLAPRTIARRPSDEEDGFDRNMEHLRLTKGALSIGAAGAETPAENAVEALPKTLSATVR